MFHHIPGQPFLFSNNDFNHFVKIVWFYVKDFYNPWEYSENKEKSIGIKT